uniref:26S proteasome complex subunit dss-1 n=1 Tax=Globodera rostochiensis TaxID=31243 RepID=A0A914HW73_GLORO
MEVDEKKGDKSDAANGAQKESELIKAAKLEDEEEFEEFPVYNKSEGADSGDAQPAINVWEDNWDDETQETDFHIQLQEELKKLAPGANILRIRTQLDERNRAGWKAYGAQHPTAQIGNREGPGMRYKLRLRATTLVGRSWGPEKVAEKLAKHLRLLKALHECGFGFVLLLTLHAHVEISGDIRAHVRRAKNQPPAFPLQ